MTKGRNTLIWYGNERFLEFCKGDLILIYSIS